MLIEEALDRYFMYIEDTARPNTVRSFKYVLLKFKQEFSKRNISDINELDIIEFLTTLTKDNSASTKNGRLSIIKAFFNFIIDTVFYNLKNPCSHPMVRRLFKTPRIQSPILIDKDLIDEAIFRTTNKRDRLILELMGRAGMRISEVLNTYKTDVNYNTSTILIREPKSRRQNEKVYITKKLCNKLEAYTKNLNSNQEEIFNISYSTAYRFVRKTGSMVNTFLRPHDLRRHAATQASRKGVPLEVVSKVILRHADIATTQRYLGEISSNEASMWVEHLAR